MTAFDPFTAIGNVVAGGIGYMGQQQTNEMQHQMMQEQQQFQERMSNTAYQRSSTDMKAAGLNPMMMFGHGNAAGTPPGANPSPAIKSGLDADALQKAVSTATQAGMAASQIKALEAETENKKAQTVTELVRPSLLETDKALRTAQTRTEWQRPGEVDARVAHLRSLERSQTAGLPIIKDSALSAANRSAMNTTARSILDQWSFGGDRASKALQPIWDSLHSAGNLFRGLKPRPGNVTHRNEYGDREITINNPPGGP